MGKSYPLIPRQVPKVETRYRRIITEIPARASLPILERLRKYEPKSMSGQPPVVWDRAEGVNVYDAYGNKWLDFSSGVLVANAGHGHPRIAAGIEKQLRKPLLHHYCFPAESRAKLVEKLSRISPAPLKKVFLLTTGAEAVECALKLCRTWGRKLHKQVVVSFEGSFHGRTLGAQMLGGMPALKEWLTWLDPDIVQVPFPGDPRNRDRRFAVFEKTLAARKIRPEQVCGVFSETYQGASAGFLPVEYARSLRKWCNRHQVLLILDEIQAGFGRTGTLFGFQHYGILPDLYCLGKGISSSLPISAVVGRPEIMDLYQPGTMTSTHTGNPLCCASALESIRVMEKGGLIKNAQEMGRVFQERLYALKEEFPELGFVCGKGLVWGLHIVKKGTKEPDGALAFKIVGRCMEKGLLFFAPVGPAGATIKVCPPLTINKSAVLEGCGVLEEVLKELT